MFSTMQGYYQEGLPSSQALRGPPDPDKLNHRKLQETFCLHWEGPWEVKYIFTSHDQEKTSK